MRDYGRVYSSFWQSPETRTFSEDARVLALYMLTSPHANLIGCFRLPDAYAADDLQWNPERVREGLLELERNGFLTRDEASKWVFIHKYLKWNAFENGNVAEAARKAFDQVPSIALKPLLAAALLEFGCHLRAGFSEQLQTLLKPFANPEPEPDPDPEPEPIRSQNQPEPIFAAPPAEDAPPPARKPKVPKSPAPTAAVWEAYSEAYEARYHVQPVRNATVNGVLAQLVARLGADAAEVARFYLSHQKAYYINKSHSVQALLSDAEALHTQCMNGRAVTSTQALQADRTQTNLSAFAPMLAEARAKELFDAEHQPS